ncbi:MAG: acetamidase/formamidase family protein [Syntrophomonadaceae bacterium]
MKSFAVPGIVVFLAAASAAAAASPADVSGEWELTEQIFGYGRAARLELTVVDGTIKGTLASGGKKAVTGTVSGDRVRFQWKDEGGIVAAYDGRLRDATMSGTVTYTGEKWAPTPPSPWTAKRAATDRPASPRTLDFDPKEFHRTFSAATPPALRIWPGDVVRTRTVDAGGVDERGNTRVLGGNPQTGPFYVEGAMPGDVLAVHVLRLRLNRSTAISDDGFVDRAITTDWASSHKDNNFKDVVWNVDLATGLARPAEPTERLRGLAVLVRPMLGCVGVAPGFGNAARQTGDSGRIGGNMDFNEIREGATVYLPVGQPGALLYVGDGHALQGDGELNGNALETSMDVEFSVDVARDRSIDGPRVENDEYLMAMGLSGSLDEAFREATSGLASWLESDYGLTGPEAAILLGATVEYKISEVADRNAGVVAKIPKKYLPPPAPKKPEPVK